MRTGLDAEAELRDLAALRTRAASAEEAVGSRMRDLHQQGVRLKDLAAAVGLSESQASRLVARARKVQAAGDKTPATAMDLVRAAQRGQIDHGQLVQQLESWRYEPQYRTRGEGDDWKFVDNSFDAVEFAYMSLDLLSDQEYERIANAAA